MVNINPCSQTGCHQAALPGSESVMGKANDKWIPITKQEIARLSAQSKIRVSTNKELQIQDELNKYKKNKAQVTLKELLEDLGQVEEKRRRGKRG